MTMVATEMRVMVAVRRGDGLGARETWASNRHWCRGVHAPSTDRHHSIAVGERA